jgi:hypothetical protein
MLKFAPGQTCAIDRTLGAIVRTRAFIFSADGRMCERSHYMCDRSQTLQNLPNLVKYEFVDLRVSFPMTPRSLQSEFYNSRYGRFGGTRRVQVISQLKFASNAPRTTLSPRINVISPRCTLVTCKTLKH